jgi:hypothetical protein
MGVANDRKVERLSSMPAASTASKKGFNTSRLAALRSGYTPNQCTW